MMTPQTDSTTTLALLNLTFTGKGVFTPQEPRGVGGDLVSPSQYYTLVACLSVFRVVVCLGGMIGNGINIRTFLRMGLGDSVTIAFFSLAISDLMILVSTFASGVIALCELFERKLNFSPLIKLFDLKVLFILFGRPFSFITTLSTMFLAVQRSLCVTIPLHFKGIFTSSRTCVIICLIWLYGLTFSVMLISQYPLKKVPVSGTNQSIIVLTRKPALRYILPFTRTVNGVVLSFTSQILVLICVCAMVYNIGRSMKFRRMNSTSVDERATQGLHKNAGGKNASVKSPVGNTKERQAIIQVSIVSTVFLITSLPFIMKSIAQMLVKELAANKRYHYTAYTCHEIHMTLTMINSAVNFFVYFRYNTRFRQACFGSSLAKE